MCAGAKNKSDAVKAISKFVEELRKVGIDAKIETIERHNAVMKFKLPFKLDLNAIGDKLSDIATYSPNLFPGIVIRLPFLGKMTALLFEYGFVVLSGVKTIETLKIFMEKIPPILKPYAIYDGIDKITRDFDYLSTNFIEMRKIDQIIKKKKVKAIKNNLEILNIASEPLKKSVATPIPEVQIHNQEPRDTTSFIPREWIEVTSSSKKINNTNRTIKEKSTTQERVIEDIADMPDLEKFFNLCPDIVQ